MSETVLRKGDIELRWSQTIIGKPSKYLEIVKWERAYCYTLLVWDKDSEGPGIRFIGDRPLKYEGNQDLWKLMKVGQLFAEAEKERSELEESA